MRRVRRRVTFVAYRLAIVKIGIVELGVAPVVRHLPNATSTVNDGNVETLVLRSEWVIVPEMPFAEDRGEIAVVTQELGHCHFTGRQ